MTFEQIKEILKNKKAGIAGCGGLGSNCAVALARIGIGNLVIVDFDLVNEGNLNRQYFFIDQIGQKKSLALRDNIGRINKNVNVEAHDLKLDPEGVIRVFHDCEIIVEAFDLAIMKQMIIETVLTEFPDKYVVSGVGLAGTGDNESITTIRHDKLIICGDLQKEVSDEMPPLAPRVGIVANMQANVVLELFLKNTDK